MKHESTGATAPDNQTDWLKVRAMRDEEIHHDDDSPSTTVEDWDGAVLKQAGVEVGRVKTRGRNRHPIKEQVSVRYSPEVLAAFRATGRGWQTRMDNALKEWLETHTPA